jgi:nitrogen fixation/metabolism regulation signal transduction histidine kinase
MGNKPSRKMAEDNIRTRKRGAPWLFGGLVLLLLSVLVVLQVFGLWEVFTPDTASDALLLYALSSLNFVAFFVFTFIFIRSLLKLRRERRERLLGSKIKTRLVVYFIAVSLLPITAMAVFSYIFFNRTLEKWFGRIPEDVVQEARLAREDELARQARALRDTATVAALAVQPQLAAGASPDLARLISDGRFDAAAIGASDGISDDQMRWRNDVYTYTTMQSKELVGSLKTALWRLYNGKQAELPFLSAQGYLADAVPLPDGRALVVARELESDSRLDKIVSGAETFEQLRMRQRRVRMLGLSTLGLLTLMLLFVATWSAIHLARGIGTPIRALAEAADKVAAGDLDHRVSAIADDELAVLAASFNQMTAQLAENRLSIERNAAELREKNLALEERRNYIETVLQSLSTGVVSLDEQDRVTTINHAALSMLRLERAPTQATPLREIMGSEDLLVIERVLRRARQRGRAAEQVELARSLSYDVENETNGSEPTDGALIPVALTATALAPRAGETRRGVVLVIEDLSDLLAAQRAAAWSEVARRLAHEIKNPLTPIQLSAERIARNFHRSTANEHRAASERHSISNRDGGSDRDNDRIARVVDECTATISREVAGLKAMVDEFSRFARLPHARLAPAELNEVVRQSLALYEDRLDGVRLDVLLAPKLPVTLLDAEQMRRVFVNLIDNSLEALAEVEGERRITVATAHDPARGTVITEVTDTGHGIAQTDFARLFQPSFSTRARGTGLGLAIVHRIITEHGGRIRAEQNRPRGARMLIELPVAEDPRESH